MKIIIESGGSGGICVLYTVNLEDVKLRDWELVGKVLEVIEDENECAIKSS